jgi:hypothetical protein
MQSFQGLSLGTMAMPAPAGDYFDTVTNGPDAGKVLFILGAGLPGSMTGAVDALFIEVIKPAAGFATGTAYNFNTDPNAATYVAASYILEDVNSQAMSYTRIMYASSGSVTFSMIGENNGAAIRGTVPATNFREVNEMTGADVAGGCTVSLASLAFFTSQQAARQAEYPMWSDGSRPLTQEELGFIGDQVAQIRANRNR